WISGFDGSAGTAVVTMDSAALWTDSRYFLAAEKQLEGTSFQLMRLKVKGTPTIARWLADKLKDTNAQVGVDGMCNNVSSVENLIHELRRQGGITVRTNFDPLNEIWKDRPAIPDHKIEVYPMKYAGETALSKMRRVRATLCDMGADGMLVSALDDIAWLLNLRGTDVHCNPVFVAYLLLSTDKATLFIDKAKLTPQVEEYLKAQDVGMESYDKVGEGLREYFEYNILLDPEETSYTLYNIIEHLCLTIY
ncbi:aminopeptidase P family N-terminal domain-containing protein, partial [Prevotella sp.]|uniref:aminopeptidase P family N-terminal domain-containing protein n=1 Tax=Prevotella sp. TaxID=59823 RepID=UPI0035B4AB2D